MTYRIEVISGGGLPATVDAGGYDTVLAADAMAAEHLDGEYRIVRDVLCVDSTGYPASLEVGRSYVTIVRSTRRGDEPVRAGWVRVVDESGEDYLYPATMFRTEVAQ